MKLTSDQIFIILFVILLSICINVWVNKLSENFVYIPNFLTTSNKFWRVNNYKHWGPWHIHNNKSAHYPVPSIHN